MKKSILFFLICLLATSFNSVFAQLHISGTSVWGSNQILSQSVIIDPGGVLIIEEGVLVQILFVDTDLNTIGDVALVVNGELRVRGKQCNPVVFEPYTLSNNKAWQGIVMNSITTNDSIHWLKINYAYKGLDVQSNTIIEGLEVKNCRESVAVQSGAVCSIDDAMIHNNVGSGVVNYGGTLTLNNSDFYDNGHFGVATFSGTLVMGFSDVRANFYGGLFIGGGANADVQNCEIHHNTGSGVEVSDMIFTSDFFAMGAQGGLPIVYVVNNNITNNASTIATLEETSGHNFYQVPPWFACPNQGSLSTNYTHYVTGPTFTEVPFGALTKVYGKFMYYANYPSTTYSIKDPVSGVTYASETADASTAGLCDGSTYERMEYLTFNLNAQPQRFYWEASKNPGQYIMFYSVTDPEFTIRAGGYEVYSTVEAVNSLNFTQNWFGQIVNVGNLMYNIDASNINYTGFKVSQIAGIGTNISDGLPIVDLGANQNICQGTPLIIDADNAGSSFYWSTGATTQTISVSGTGTYSVSVTNACGSKSDTIVITGVDPLPLQPVNPIGQTLLCQNSINTQYKITNSLYADTYSWTISPPGAGVITGTDTVGTVNWDAGFVGNATINVRGINTCGNGPVSGNIIVQIITSPNAAATPVGPVSVCIGTALSTYTTTGIGGASSYTWAISPPSAGTILVAGNNADVIWTPGFSGTANISVQGVNTCGSGTFSTPLSVLVSAAPGLPATPTGVINICQNAANETYTTSGALNAVSYSWDISPDSAGTVTGTSTNATIDWNNIYTGQVTVNVAGVNACGTGTVSSNLTVHIHAAPAANITGDTMVCRGATAMLNAIGGISYHWSTLDSVSSISVSPVTSTTYYVTIADAIGCTASAQHLVVVNPLPVIFITGNNMICKGTNTTMSATGASSYMWSSGSNTNTETLSPLVSTTYYVTGTNGNGCSSVVSFHITVLPSPNATIVGDTAICTGESTVLSTLGIGSVIWNTGDTTNAITISPIATLPYSVTVTGSNGCVASDGTIVTLNSVPSIPTIVYYGGELISSATSGNQWYYEGVPIPGQTNQTFSPLQNGNYTVVVTVGGCSSESVPYNWVFTGIINPESENTTLIMYPNPGNEYLNFDWESLSMVHQITFINALGAVVKTVHPSENTSGMHLDVTGLAKGIYFIKLGTSDGEINKKWIKQ